MHESLVGANRHSGRDDNSVGGGFITDSIIFGQEAPVIGGSPLVSIVSLSIFHWYSVLCSLLHEHDVLCT